MNRVFFILGGCLLFLIDQSSQAAPYFEAGTSLGSSSNGAAFFQQSAANASSSGFVGSFNLYFPVTSQKNFFHFDFGFQNRLTTGSTSAGDPLAMASVNVAARLEISRIFIGGGYAPLDFVSKPGSGVTSLHTNSGASSYFLEGGVIWRIIPEFQICAVYARETGMVTGGGTSPTNSEYGLRFRFPLNSSDTQAASGVDFDGFRYPFGFMK